ncbi:MAG: dihydrolipoamide acetyltransferase family protein [Ornithinimicrobium sp.]|uniref:dihydrolipoamide acetyltransferase family protein n=1 Tax=Ornithinimicrobium sp. TaxID=1977084 RepID=UPI003D9B2C81
MPQFKLPDPGEGLVEAEIVTWKVKAGDTVKTNDIVVEIETAKSLVELPIPFDGTVTALLADEGDTVDVGTPIIDIDDGSGGGGQAAGAQEDQATGTAESEDVQTTAESEQGDPDDLVPEPPEEPKREANLVGYGPSEGSTQRRRRRSGGAAGETSEPEPERPKAKAKPPVRKYAKDKGVDLTQVRPTREDGVVTRADVDAHLVAASTGDPGSGHSPAQAPTAGVGPAGSDRPAAGGEAPAADPGSERTTYTPPSFDRSGERETRTPVKGVRKMTAQAMTGSAFSAPHVSEFVTLDMTATMELVERLKADREFRDLKVSPLLILAKALVIAVRRNPGVNAMWDDDAQEIVQRHYVNLGIAAATPRGLIVPNIKDADLMDLLQLAQAMADLVATARAGRTQPSQMSAGTITITNVGVFGVDTGTPIINPGESAIVCFGAVRRQPWVVTGADGQEEIVPRWITQLAVSFDHRLIDGELGSRFLADLAALLEDPSRALVWG